MNTLMQLFPTPSCEPTGSQMDARALCSHSAPPVPTTAESTRLAGRYGFGLGLTLWRYRCSTAEAATTRNRLNALDVRADADATHSDGETWDTTRQQNRDARRHLIYGETGTEINLPSEGTAADSWFIRWLEDAETRIPMVVIPRIGQWANPEDASDHAVTAAASLALVVPVWTDVENAVPGDLVLDAAETTTGVTWRAAFRHQTRLPKTCLGESLGRLTNHGAQLFAAALDGHVSAERTGSPLESEFDPRLTADSWIEEAIARALQQLAVDDDDGDWILDVDATASKESALTLPELPGVMQLRPRFVSANQSQFTLAAAPAASPNDECLLESTELGGEIVAKLQLDWESDELRMEMVEVPPALAGSELTIAVSATGRETLMTTGRIIAGEIIVLTREKAIDQWDVEYVELRLS